MGRAKRKLSERRRPLRINVGIMKIEYVQDTEGNRRCMWGIRKSPEKKNQIMIF